MTAKILPFPVKYRDDWKDVRASLAEVLMDTRPEIAAAIRKADKC